jgi:tetratricopeptide (TPR) repeat protein
MRNLPCSALVAGALVLLVIGGRAADAAVTVMGGGLAETCSKAARSASSGWIVGQEMINLCTLALETEILSTHDKAGTYINRGVLRLSRSAYRDAKHDFDIAIQLAPMIGEAYVNRGAALIGAHRFAESLADIDKGLALGPEEPEKAYFNRGLAHEYLDQLKDAYLDYQKALELKPDWDAPQKELARFTLTRPAKGNP